MQAVPTPAPAPQQQAKRAPVTPLHKPSTTTRNAAPAEMNEILTVHPKAYKDAQVIAENFREGVPVIINLSQMTDDDARRLIDFASGLSIGLYGKIERVTAKVFLLSPSHVAVSGEQSATEAERSRPPSSDADPPSTAMAGDDGTSHRRPPYLCP